MTQVLDTSYTQEQISELKISIVKDFFSHDVIKVNTTKLFVLSSGLQLPIYLDHRRIFSFPDLRKKVIKAWTELLKKHLQSKHNLQLQNNTNVIFSGTATAGIAPAYGLSSYFESGFIYVRDKSKAYGLHSQIEGVIEPNNKFIVVDDMVVTGGSLLKNAQVLKNLYGTESILCATSISCHESTQMRKIFEQNSIIFLPLFTTAEIFGIAHKSNVIDIKTYETLIECLKQFNASP